jgi:hypothetical protein
MSEERDKTSENQVVRNEKGQIIQGTANPAGRPKGVKNFKTIFEEAVKKIAKEKDLDPDSVEIDLVIRAISSARGGDYKYYKDLFDRIYGQPKQSFGFDSDDLLQEIKIEIKRNDSKPAGDNSIPEESPGIPEKGE